MRETFLLKLAASVKTHRLVKHALDLHRDDGKQHSPRHGHSLQHSTNAISLLNYSKESEKTEVVGGLWWCWKGYLSRSLIHKEGLMVNYRLFLCSVLQFSLAIGK